MSRFSEHLRQVLQRRGVTSAPGKLGELLFPSSGQTSSPTAAGAPSGQPLPAIRWGQTPLGNLTYSSSPIDSPSFTPLSSGNFSFPQVYTQNIVSRFSEGGQVPDNSAYSPLFLSILRRIQNG